MMGRRCGVIDCMMKKTFIRTTALMLVLAAGCPALTINLGNNHDRNRRETREQREENDRYARRRARGERHRRPESRSEHASGWERLLRGEKPRH